MTPLAQKTNQTFLFKLYFIAGALIMAGAVIVTPISIISIDPALMTNGFVLGVVLIAMLFFGLVGFFGFVRPFLLMRKLPDVQAETDGTYLYIHSIKEAKIPLDQMDGTYLDAETPYLMTQDFLVHFFSERCGNVVIKVPNYGKYKLYYISRAKEVPGMIATLISER